MERLITNMPPLVSVITPFFNPAEQFLREAVGSVIAQTYSNWEIVLVNDGSAECAGLRAARTLAEAMSERIHVVTYDQPGNRGASSARNEGLRYARGAYIAFLDADDVWLPGKLKTEIEILESEPAAAMVYSSYLYWYSWTGCDEDMNKDWIPALGITPGRLIAPPQLLTLVLRGAAAVPPMCATFRKDALEAVGGFECSFPGLYDDQVLFAKIGLRFPVLPLQVLTTLYRQHPLSTCATANADAEREARAKFLTWLCEYLERAAILDWELRSAVRSEIWNLENPRLARALRWLRKRPGWQLARARRTTH